MKIKKLFFSIIPVGYAHCDVPCGIYDPKAAQIAAQTVLKMVEKINELSLPDFSKKEEVDEYLNSMTRFVWTKEEHSRKCKEELLILWTDYFKPEHLALFPNLHDVFWKAAKLCSCNKQCVDITHAQELVEAVDQIADMFVKTKSSTNKPQSAK
ncbi:MAG: superoxide dismutase, Ni [Candidatus Levybacteria bacterium RIFCSPHIGHO2_02_FULL_42_12]|nr:MAG: superoxide dismutase, Ni [Candidatus Levybacteria bacterium RIFCSPHIGHO2_02_FULL_42_12]OGH42927.1 MAG: superoxide dismutase, Ni [Candidatus Levybacteria bacterium RIFCSPLOWO2_01_FULL_42_15]